MSIEGIYELTLGCEANGCTHKQTFLEKNRAEAKATARYDGWRIPEKENRKILCPFHREEKK